jgi:hypothetical protein
MITRRSLLVASAAIAAGSLILPRFANRLASCASELLNVPKDPRIWVTACTEFDLELNIGNPRKEPPPMTWREFLLETGRIGAGQPVDERMLEQDWDISPIDLDNECAHGEEHWDRNKSSWALAYRYLDALDLGAILDEHDRDHPCLDFIDGDHPGSSYLAVRARDERALSFLQHRLNELGTGAAVRID